MDLGYFCSTTTKFGVNLLANFTLVVTSGDSVDKLHTAGLSGTVFAVAVLAEAIPLPVTACPHNLVEEAHVVERISDTC